MKENVPGLPPEERAKLLKEAGIAAEQLANIKKLRNTVGSMIDDNDKSVVEILKDLLKQPKKK